MLRNKIKDNLSEKRDEKNEKLFEILTDMVDALNDYGHVFGHLQIQVSSSGGSFRICHTLTAFYYEELKPISRWYDIEETEQAIQLICEISERFSVDELTEQNSNY